MSVRSLIKLMTEARCSGLGLDHQAPKADLLLVQPWALSTTATVSRMLGSGS